MVRRSVPSYEAVFQFHGSVLYSLSGCLVYSCPIQRQLALLHHRLVSLIYVEGIVFVHSHRMSSLYCCTSWDSVDGLRQLHQKYKLRPWVIPQCVVQEPPNMAQGQPCWLMDALSLFLQQAMGASYDIRVRRKYQGHRLLLGTRCTSERKVPHYFSYCAS